MSLQAVNLTKTFHRPFSRKPPVEAVKEVNFKIESGEIFALLGPNGAGKSTIIKMIAGLIEPTRGSVVLNGHEMTGHDAGAYKELSAVLEGSRNVYWRLTPLENLHYFANLRGVRSAAIKDRALSLLSMLDIEGKKKNQSQHLSRGMLQKLALAAALITNPNILLLDEPVLGLDVGSSRKIKEVLQDLAKNEGKTILLTTHQMDLVEELADRVGIIQNGTLIREGSLTDLKAIFQSFIYRFKIRGEFTMPAEWSGAQGAKYIASHPEYCEIELDCRDNDGVYRVIDELRANRKEIISMGRVVEDLEEVFMMVLSGENERVKGAEA